MTVDETLLALVRKEARRFCERHCDEFVSTELEARAGFSPKVLDEVVELGWLASTSAADPREGDAADSALLQCLVAEIGNFSPALSCRLLAHHFCRVCIESGKPDDQVAVSALGEHWLAHDAGVGDPSIAPSLHVEGSELEPRLTGTLRFVVAGDVAPKWLGLAEAGTGDLQLVLVDSANAAMKAPVKTLGLRGLGIVEGSFTAAANGHRVLGQGRDAQMALRAAYRFIAPGTMALVVGILEQTHRLALGHAQLRRQNGRLLGEIPAVRGMLTTIERAILLVRQLQYAHGLTGDEAELLCQEALDAARRATDSGLQVFGGAGYVVGNGIERLWRDVRQLTPFVLRR